MRTIAAIISIVILTAGTKVKSQENSDCPCNLKYGVSASLSNSGSGHGGNYTLAVNVNNDKKGMELGMMMDDQGIRAKGIDFKYKVYTGKKSHYLNQTQFMPFVAYNFVYQSDFNKEPDVIETSFGEIVNENPEMGKISTMEHYIGLGLKVAFKSNIYLEGYAGVGGYIGSLDKAQETNTLGVHKFNHGFTSSVNITLGFTLL